MAMDIDRSTIYTKQMEKYRNGNETEKQIVVEFFCEELQNMIYHEAHCVNHPALFEDLCQEGRLAIVQKIETYDETKSLPSTYFRYHIKYAMQEYANKMTNRSRQSSATVHKIREAELNAGRQLDDIRLSKILGISPETIKNCRRVESTVTVSEYENEVADIPADEFTNPEFVVERKEDAECVDRVINQLGDTERNLIAYTYGLFGEQRSDTDIAKLLGMPLACMRRMRADILDRLKDDPKLRAVANVVHRPKADNPPVNRFSQVVFAKNGAMFFADELDSVTHG